MFISELPHLNLMSFSTFTVNAKFGDFSRCDNCSSMKSVAVCNFTTAVILLLCISLLCTEEIYECCKWRENTSLVTLTNQTQKSLQSNQSECCRTCMIQQLNDTDIKFAIYVEPYCYCMYYASKIKATGFQLAAVQARVIWFDDNNENFEPNYKGDIHINFCAKETSRYELLPVDLSHIQNYTDVMYFHRSLLRRTIHPKSGKIIRVYLTKAIDNIIINTQVFKIGTLEKTTKFLLAFIHTSSGSIAFHLKPFTVTNVTKNGFVELQYPSVQPQNSVPIKCIVKNDHSETNVDLWDVSLTYYYDNKMLRVKESTTSAYTTLVKVGVHPMSFQASTMAIGSLFDVTAHFKHLPNNNMRVANVFVETQAPAYKNGTLHKKFFYMRAFNRPFEPEEKQYVVYFLYLSGEILWCYHDQFRTVNFCGIYDLRQHEMFVLPAIFIEPIAYNKTMQELYFYNSMGATLAYDLRTQSHFVTRNYMSNLSTGDLVLPFKQFPCCRYGSASVKFDENTTLSVSRAGWSVNDVVIVSWV